MQRTEYVEECPLLLQQNGILPHSSFAVLVELRSSYQFDDVFLFASLLPLKVCDIRQCLTTIMERHASLLMKAQQHFEHCCVPEQRQVVLKCKMKCCR